MVNINAKFVTTALLLLVLSAAVSAHAAEVVITAGTCKPTTAAAADIGPCIAGSVLTLTGTDIPADATVTIGRNEAEQALIRCVDPKLDDTSLTCTIAVEESAVFGEYPITLSSGVSAGNIVYGEFLQQTIAGWNTHKLNDHVIVSAYSNDWPSTGDEWLIYGTFDTTKSYTVLFYNVDADTVEGNGGKTPLCAHKEPVSSYSIRCEITIETQVMGMWRFLVVEDNDGPIVPGSSALPSIAVNPPLPTATSATGDCAIDSAKCITGNSLTITGTNFNARDIKNNIITIGTEDKITCAVTAVTETELTCTLTVADGGVAAGVYPITVKVLLCSHPMKSPAAPLGNLVMGEYAQQAIGGWSMVGEASAGTSVSGQSSEWPSTGDDWLIYGTFDTTKSYTVLFYNVDADTVEGNAGKTPLCTIKDPILPYSITCQITIDTQVMGMWGFLVREGDDGPLVPGSTGLPSIAVNPPLPTATSATGDCATDSAKCITGNSLTITGTNFNARDIKNNIITIGADNKVTCAVTAATETELTCTLTVGEAVTPGVYPISVQVLVCNHGMKSPAAPLGNLVMGEYAQQAIGGWSMVGEASAGTSVSGQSSEWPSTGDDWLIYGTFDTAKTYKVLFYNVDADTVEGNGGKTPLCTIKDPILPYSITCQITIDTQVMGMWGFLVREGDDGPIVPGSTGLPSIAVNPPLPTATSATGDCATDSAKCITGNSLTITGTNFNARDNKNNLITIGTDDKITCAVTAATETELTCTLKVADGGAAPGVYPISVQVLVCSHPMKSPAASLGYFVYGVPDSPGWKDDAVVGTGVESVVPRQVKDGSALTFVGTFETAATYTVSFESVAAASSAVPQCKVTTVTATTVTCKYDGMPGVYGSWRPKLLANGFVLGMAPGTDAQTVTLEPLPPVVEDVSGDCAKDSKKCVTGAQLTFTGKGFNADAKRHRVTIDGMQDGECKVLQGTQQSIVCELTISASKSRASADDVSGYRMSLHTAVTDGNWLPTTAYIGTLMLTTGSDTIPGIVNTSVSPMISIAEENVYITKKSNKAAVVFAVLFGILFLAYNVGLAFVLWKYKIVRRPSVGVASAEFWNAAGGAEAKDMTTLEGPREKEYYQSRYGDSVM